MSTDKIKIDNVTGGKDKNLLKNCYFLPSSTPGVYTFFDTNNNLLAGNLTSGESWEFTMHGYVWQVDNFAIDSMNASGSWINDDPDNVDPAAEESGTFTAQAGGGLEEEPAEGTPILPLEQITIREVRSRRGGTAGNMLLGCFFSPAGPKGQYLLFTPDGKQLQTNVETGRPFFFQLHAGEWEMTSDFSTLERKAHGSWRLIGPIDEEDSGTFTAQAGGGAEAASSAYA